MTTICVARLGAQVAIASDRLVTFGDTRLAHGYEANDKLFKVGDTWFGMAGTTAHFPVMQRALKALLPAELKTGSRDELFDTFLKIHPRLKEQYFLNTKEDDDDPYESSQVTMLAANASGIYGIYSYREVFEFQRFWSIGSGRQFALGAMHAAWDGSRSARTLAEIGVRAGCEFDKNSAGPVSAHTIRLGAASRGRADAAARGAHASPGAAKARGTRKARIARDTRDTRDAGARRRGRDRQQGV